MNIGLQIATASPKNAYKVSRPTLFTKPTPRTHRRIAQMFCCMTTLNPIRPNGVERVASNLTPGAPFYCSRIILFVFI